MNEDSNNPPNVPPTSPTNTATDPATAQPQTVQPIAVPEIAQQQSQAAQPIVFTSETQPQQQPTSAATPIIGGQIPVGMSASQMGYNQPDHTFNMRGLIIKVLVALGVLGCIFAVLVFTNVIALKEFKSIRYESAKGAAYALDFYTKHGSKQLNTGSKQLVSKVSKDGKFPLTLSIADSNESGYNRAKGCTGAKKVFEVTNNHLDQKITVCDFASNQKVGGQSMDNLVYIAGFTHNDQAYIVTISQNFSSAESGTEETRAKLGMEPYREDIERIVASIRAE